ncbi:MAG TPA: thioredoxin domain-containing protein [Edaphobacter sp.]
MPTGSKPLQLLLVAFTLAVAGCRAQVPVHGADGPVQAGDKLSPELARRVAVLLRSKANLPPNYDVVVGSRTGSNVPGFDEISVTFTSDGRNSKPLTFLLSKDGKTLAQFNKFDISKDPKTLVSDTGRPARGGPQNAPVLIVGFDDLQCPFCAKMHAQLFPALLDRYKDQVRIVYRDFPLDQHPWAMRAAINANCLGAQSATGYWNLVDYIHAHAGEMGGEEKSVTHANAALDGLTREEGKRQKVDLVALDACIAKQDDSAVKASVEQATALGVEATPALFINGEKLDGAVPLEYVYRMIDKALIASGQTPPPPPPPPAPAAKSGN